MSWAAVLRPLSRDVPGGPGYVWTHHLDRAAAFARASRVFGDALTLSVGASALPLQAPMLWAGFSDEPRRRRLVIAWGGRVRLHDFYEGRHFVCDGANEWLWETKTKKLSVRAARESAVCLLAWLVDRTKDVELTALDVGEGDYAKASGLQSTSFYLARGSARIELEVRANGLEPYSLHLDDETLRVRIRVTDFEQNASAGAELFRVRPPKGTPMTGKPLLVPPPPPQPTAGGTKI